MSETAKVRLVRCPKCENLLPEVTDYSVYQCGGCGAVLRAKNKGVDLDTFSEKSDEGINGVSVEKLSDRYDKMMNVSERKMMDTSDGSESDVRSNISSSSRAERRRFLRNRGENTRTNLISKDENWDAEANIIQDKKSDELQRAKVAQGFDDFMMYHQKSEMEGLWRAQRIDAEVMRHMKEGPSNLVSRSGYDYENPSYVDGFNNIDYVGEDRAELLKKLDELQYQLSQSGNLIDKGKEKFCSIGKWRSDPYESENWYSDASSEMNRASMQNSYHDPQMRRPPPYRNQYAEPPPLMHRQEMGLMVLSSAICSKSCPRIWGSIQVSHA
ncbi:hypothetical protein DH2020_029153 [Rehmannia glutinosa]|uniref:Enhanced disease resistance 4-like N-terminal domain-containing protein n=1 Tax=Rehmannia glutinosa TaxID=99300 RepID=A0ABR0VS17_REHGL